jgi:Ca2+-binding EF-hand superfamily protein
LLFRSLGEDMSEQQASNLCSGGGLSFSAFLDNRQQKWAAQQAGNILRHAFSILDWSGQGYVDANDLRRLLTSQGERLTQGEVEDLIRDAGGGQQVDYNAFVETMIRKNV